MAFQRVRRALANVPNPSALTSPAGTQKIDLPRDHYYERINILVTMTVDGAGGGTAVQDDILRFMQRFTVLADGREAIKSISGRSLYYKNQIDYRTAGTKTNLTNGTAAGQVIKAHFTLDFAKKRWHKQYAAVLQSNKYQSLELQVAYGNLTDLITGATAVIQALTVQVEIEQIIPEQMPTGLVIYKEVEQQLAIVGSSLDVVKDLNRGNLYTGMFFLVLGNNARSDTQVTNLKVLQNSVFISHNYPFPILQAMVKQWYEIETLPTGIAYVEFDLDGDFSSAIESQKLDTFQMAYSSAAASGGTDTLVWVQEELYRAA